MKVNDLLKNLTFYISKTLLSGKKHRFYGNKAYQEDFFIHKF